MKKSKKLAALVLAMVMAFSLMAVTASAYSAEDHQHTHVCSADTIQPRIPAPRCPQCDTAMRVIRTSKDTEGKTYTDFECPNSSCSYKETLKIYW